MGLCGTLTSELFWLEDGSIVVNELAPRVHNSGHWTIDGAETSQFEQHIRAITGLGLGSPAALAPTAVVNLLGTGPQREARLTGLGEALADPAVHLHLYDKRRVFERRKMGHLRPLGPDADVALERAHGRTRRPALGRGVVSSRRREPAPSSGSSAAAARTSRRWRTRSRSSTSWASRPS